MRSIHQIPVTFLSALFCLGFGVLLSSLHGQELPLAKNQSSRVRRGQAQVHQAVHKPSVSRVQNPVSFNAAPRSVNPAAYPSQASTYPPQASAQTMARAPRKQLSQSVRIAQRKIPRVEMSDSSRRYAMQPQTSQTAHGNVTNIPLSPGSSTSIAMPVNNGQTTGSRVVSRVGMSGLSAKDLSGISFASPEKFLKSGKFKFANPDQFLKKQTPKIANESTKPATRKIPTKMASSRKLLNRKRQDQERQIEPLEPNASNKRMVDVPRVAQRETNRRNSQETKPRSDAAPEEEFLSVADVREPISLNPFSDIVQNDPNGTIEDESPLFRPQVAGRSYSEITGLPFQPHSTGWTAHRFQHKPLYFEEVNLERYGNQLRYQNLFSAAHFFGSAVILPYKIGQRPPTCCETTLGHYRPGECVPYQIHRRPFTKQGFLYQALAITALSL